MISHDLLTVIDVAICAAIALRLMLFNKMVERINQASCGLLLA
nr:hypothetical protein [Pantoea agglomerans]